MGDPLGARAAERQIRSPDCVVTDQPMFFVGGGAADAKPRAGYEVAVIEMTVDNVGLGKGTMTAAARVKPGGDAGCGSMTMRRSRFSW